MKNRTLLCVGLLTIISTATSNTTEVMAKSPIEVYLASPKNAISLSQNAKAEAYKRSGLDKQNSGDDRGAIADFNRAIALDPNFALAYYDRGLSKGNLGYYSAAISDYNRAISLNRNDSDFYTARGFSKYMLGNKSGALADYQQAVQIDNNPVALKNINGLRQDEQQRTLRYMNGAGYIHQNTPAPRGLLPR